MFVVTTFVSTAARTFIGWINFVGICRPICKMAAARLAKAHEMQLWNFPELRTSHLKEEEKERCCRFGILRSVLALKVS